MPTSSAFMTSIPADSKYAFEPAIINFPLYVPETPKPAFSSKFWTFAAISPKSCPSTIALPIG